MTDALFNSLTSKHFITNPPVTDSSPSPQTVPSNLLHKTNQISKLICLLQLSWPSPLKPVVRSRMKMLLEHADRRCSNYIWVINSYIALWCAFYIRGLMAIQDAFPWHNVLIHNWTRIEPNHAGYPVSFTLVMTWGLFNANPDSRVYGANMGPMNLANRETITQPGILSTSTENKAFKWL